MRDYVIWTPGYVTHYGGVAVLHRLCHELNTLGYRAYLVIADGGGTNPQWRTPVVPATGYDVTEAIVVYPEIVKDNPLGAKLIVRWLLARAKVPDDGYTVSFSKVISQEYDVFFLTVLSDQVWYPGGRVRSGKLLWRGKADYRGVPTDRRDVDCTLVTRHWPETQEGLADLFRKSELLVSYDELSAVNIEAAMCGCPVLIRPSGLWSNLDFENGEYGLNGIAWGEHDLPRAIRTLPDVRHVHRNLIRTQDDRVREFVRRTQGRWPKESSKAT